MKRGQEEIDRVLDWARDGFECGSKYPGMSYEEGVRDAIEWITGETNDAPDGE